MHNLPGTWKVPATHRHYPGTTPFSMAHTGNRLVLLEKNGLSDSGRCILKVHHSEEITKFHLCSHVYRVIYDCHRTRLTPHESEVIMVHATIPKSSSRFCNVTASHTKPTAQTIPDLMDLLREWSELPRS